MKIPLLLAVSVALTAILALPVILSLEHLEQPPSLVEAILGATGLVLLIVAAIGRFRSPVALTLVVILTMSLLLLRCMHFGLVEFSGDGFGKEVFIHAEWQSVVLAWQDHSRTLRRVAILVVLLAGLLYLAVRCRSRLPVAWSWVMLFGGLGLTFFASRAMPEVDLWNAWQQWSRPLTSEVDSAWLDHFESIGLVSSDVFPKARIEASIGDEPRNLILVYVESLGRNLTEQDQWPELMPNTARLLEQHAWVDAVWASGFITIEGLTNSMCGTLFPFNRGNDSMAAGEGLAEELPCLGDVLEAAGYQRVYMGGARMSFAGKGAFLAAHGYDDQRGLDFWRAQGLRPRSGTWGLSDVDLFEQATLEIGRLREAADPFNLTLLTIGTHLPGYRYDECTAYPHSDHAFLQALHCTDQVLHSWIESLQTLGYLENTLLVITADHHVFPNPEMRELFGQAVFDRRLPLIVIGDELPPPAVESGASYDLAPTLLDLLDIEHNVGFMLGRSLAQDHARPDYYVTRFKDMHLGERVDNLGGPCASVPSLLEIPLSHCTKAGLMSLLEALTSSVSAPALAIQCESDINRLEVPSSVEEAVSLVIAGVAIEDRFTYRSRPVDGKEAGLYFLEFDDSLVLMGSGFLPISRLQSSGDLLAEMTERGIERMLLTWKPNQNGDGTAEDTMLSDWVDLDDLAAWALINNQGQVVQQGTGFQDGSELMELDLNRVLCTGKLQ